MKLYLPWLYEHQKAAYMNGDDAWNYNLKKNLFVGKKCNKLSITDHRQYIDSAPS